jgi:hypothetical protein
VTKKILLHIFVVFSFYQNVFAIEKIDAKIFKHHPYRIIRTTIGAKCHNRISFENIKIRQVVGDQQEYQMIHDNLGGHLFLLPKVPPKQKICISIITENNLVQEFELEVREDVNIPIIVRFSQI